MDSSTRPRYLTAIALGLLVAVICLAAGCGRGGSSSAGDEPPAAPPPSGAAGGAPSGGPGIYGAPKRTLEVARCLRTHGFDVADPDSQGRLMLDSTLENDPEFQKALAECGKMLGGGSFDRGSSSDTQAAVKFARCMRKHGVKVPDPDPNAPGIAIGGPGINPNDPKVQKAIQACQKLLPKNGTF
jgi:hypothetical protein